MKHAVILQALHTKTCKINIYSTKKFNCQYVQKVCSYSNVTGDNTI